MEEDSGVTQVESTANRSTSGSEINPQSLLLALFELGFASPEAADDGFAYDTILRYY